MKIIYALLIAGALANFADLLLLLLAANYLGLVLIGGGLALIFYCNTKQSKSTKHVDR